MTRAMTRKLKGMCVSEMVGVDCHIFGCCPFLFFLRFSFSREVPKPKRRAPPRQKDKKEKEKTPKKETEVAEIKVEGLENLKSVEDEVKLEEEIVEDPDGPRK